jgi:hypothetical protein
MMSYSTKQAKIAQQNDAKTPVAQTQTLLDQRPSTAMQLQQQKLIHSGTSSSSSAVLQQVTKSTVGGWERFEVQKGDLGKGTGTTSSTRAYVNDPSTKKPASISFAYHKIGVSPGTVTATQLDNPKSTLSYKSGSYWDAGHKLGRQNGGSGSDNDWVFPQTPSVNQGNTRNMTDKEKEEYEEYVDSQGGDTMSAKWRAHEDSFKELVNTSATGGYWWFKSS